MSAACGEDVMARALANRLEKEADEMDARAAEEEHAGNQRALCAEARGLRRGARIAAEFAEYGS